MARISSLKVAASKLKAAINGVEQGARVICAAGGDLGAPLWTNALTGSEPHTLLRQALQVHQNPRCGFLK